jgi:hypothetical protein
LSACRPLRICSEALYTLARTSAVNAFIRSCEACTQAAEQPLHLRDTCAQPARAAHSSSASPPPPPPRTAGPSHLRSHPCVSAIRPPRFRSRRALAEARTRTARTSRARECRASTRCAAASEPQWCRIGRMRCRPSVVLLRAHGRPTRHPIPPWSQIALCDAASEKRSLRVVLGTSAWPTASADGACRPHTRIFGVKRVFGLCVRSIEHARVRQLARSYPGHTGRRTHTRRHNKGDKVAVACCI